MFETFTETTVDKRWRQQMQPAPIVVAIIRRPVQDGQDQQTAYLLIRRKKAPYHDQWALVGGKWDFGELLSEAVVREVKEETGLSTRFMGLQGIVSERLIPSDQNSTGAAHFLILVCQLDVVSGFAREQQEGTVAWFNPAEIGKLHLAGNIIPSDYAMLKAFGEAESIPFFEAEMIAGFTDGPVGKKPDLRRFEQIMSHAPITR
jgi:8-oxo-dGTP diphosphatase